jgi:hypothetical protein
MSPFSTHTPSRVRRVPRAAYAVGSLTLLLCVTACGGSEGPGAASSTPGSSSAASAAATASVSPSPTPTSTATTAAPVPVPESSGPTRITAGRLAAIVEQALDPTSAAKLSVVSGLGFLSGQGQIDFRPDSASLQVTLTSSETGDDQTFTARIIDDVMYIADGDRFLRIAADDPANPFGASLSNQLDPRKMLQNVEASFVSARDRGTVEQDGQQLSVYRVVADGPSLVDAIAPEAASQPDVVVPATVTCDLRVDAQGRARRIVIDLGDDLGAFTYTLDSWRTDVDIAAPPAGEVDDLSLP